ncbi:MAG: DUF3826 domain-containing protein [Prevotellaceae bacterium]|jgi:hypothetical protein|nr:DUF3826 domain-containing protein [Prevotellaceae bacterium]
MKQLILLALLLLGSSAAVKAIDLNSAGRDAKYVETIVKRSQKIVDKLGLTNDSVAKNVCHIIANRYFEVNDIFEKFSTQAERDAALYRSHFAFPGTLSLYLDAAQIEQVKDGITYGVLQVTYKATLEMIPTLTAQEKAQIYAWLVEAREFAIDAESSEKRHAAFGKYKGRINNYLSARGYDLKKEREAWTKRIEAQKQKK